MWSFRLISYVSLCSSGYRTRGNQRDSPDHGVARTLQIRHGGGGTTGRGASRLYATLSLKFIPGGTRERRTMDFSEKDGIRPTNRMIPVGDRPHSWGFGDRSAPAASVEDRPLVGVLDWLDSTFVVGIPVEELRTDLGLRGWGQTLLRHQSPDGLYPFT